MLHGAPNNCHDRPRSESNKFLCLSDSTLFKHNESWEAHAWFGAESNSWEYSDLLCLRRQFYVLIVLISRIALFGCCCKAARHVVTRFCPGKLDICRKRACPRAHSPILSKTIFLLSLISLLGIIKPCVSRIFSFLLISATWYALFFLSVLKSRYSPYLVFCVRGLVIVGSRTWTQDHSSVTLTLLSPHHLRANSCSLIVRCSSKTKICNCVHLRGHTRMRTRANSRHI